MLRDLWGTITSDASAIGDRLLGNRPKAPPTTSSDHRSHSESAETPPSAMAAQRPNNAFLSTDDALALAVREPDGTWQGDPVIVRKVQRELIAWVHGNNGQPAFKDRIAHDGVFGPITKAALNAYIAQTKASSSMTSAAQPPPQPNTAAAGDKLTVEQLMKLEPEKIKALQEMIGAKVDGIVGPETLTKYFWKHPSDLVDTGELIRTRGGYKFDPQVVAMQKLLTDMGFNPGPPDGLFGPLTEAALKEFQGRNSLQQSGTLNKETKEKLITSTLFVPRG